MHAAGLNWQTQWNDNYKTRLSVTDSRDRYETQPSFYLTNTQLRNYLFSTSCARTCTSSRRRWSGVRTI